MISFSAVECLKYLHNFKETFFNSSVSVKNVFIASNSQSYLKDNRNVVSSSNFILSFFIYYIS